MTTQATLAWQTTAAVLAALMPSITWAGTVNGGIAFPGRTPPAATVYVRSLDGLTLHQQRLKGGETEYSLEVPAGRYWVFARPEEPGLAGLYGAHTQFSLCSRRSTTADAADCQDHALAVIEVAAGSATLRVDIDDWMLSEETATQLDGIFGPDATVMDGAELGRPRFSEYRVPRSADQAAAVDLVSEPRAAPFAAQLEEATLAGSNFAGRFTLVRVACGDHCQRVAIVDRANGAITLPDALSQGLGSLPCRAEHELDFRDNSRLLEFTRREAEVVVTDYLLWDTEQRKLAPLAQYRRSLERFCDGTTAAQ